MPLKPNQDPIKAKNLESPAPKACLEKIRNNKKVTSSTIKKPAKGDIRREINISKLELKMIILKVLKTKLINRPVMTREFGIVNVSKSIILILKR